MCISFPLHRATEEVMRKIEIMETPNPPPPSHPLPSCSHVFHVTISRGRRRYRERAALSEAEFFRRNKLTCITHNRFILRQGSL